MQESKPFFKLNNQLITVELLVVCRISQAGKLTIVEDKFCNFKQPCRKQMSSELQTTMFARCLKFNIKLSKLSKYSIRKIVEI